MIIPPGTPLPSHPQELTSIILEWVKEVYEEPYELIIGHTGDVIYLPVEEFPNWPDAPRHMLGRNIIIYQLQVGSKDRIYTSGPANDKSRIWGKWLSPDDPNLFAVLKKMLDPCIIKD